MIIAIDGTVSSGKSTAARAVAERLGLLYINTGLMYRAVAAYARAHGIATSDTVAVAQLVTSLRLDLQTTGQAQRVFVNGQDLTDAARAPENSAAVSDVADNVAVRTHLVAEQRRLGLAARPGAVMEGRDIGSVVFPAAEYKFFVTAPAEVRARRRCAEFAQQGQTVPYETVLSQVIERDRRDRERPIGALKQLPEALVIDTGDLSKDETVAAIINYIQK